MTPATLLATLDDRSINAREAADRDTHRAAACLIRRLLDPAHAEFCRIGEERL